MANGLNTGNAKAALKARGDDLYETPSVATVALLQAEKLPECIWEPACGPGSIVRSLRGAGHRVYAIAIRAYAKEIEGENPDLALQLDAWATREAMNPTT